MFVKQVSVFLENKAGRLGNITALLKAEKIDIRAFSIADTTEFGILRLIVKEPQRAVDVLRNADMTAQLNEVIVAVMPDKIGSLDEVVKPICDAGIDIKYLYSFIGEKEATGRVAIFTDDMNGSYEILKKQGIELSTQDEI
ncbi:MAG: hypothetical protein IKW64_04865 [Clostridia bacterium]|nr:hypothetical protein [Clostridia bacterium]